MWSIDLFLDFNWSKDQISNWPIEPKLTFESRFESLPDLMLTQKVYGDDFGIKHLRFTGNFFNEEQVRNFTSTKLMSIKNAYECFSGLVSGVPLNFGVFSGKLFATCHFEHKDAENPAPAAISTMEQQGQQFDYKAFGQAFSTQFPGIEPYVFYLKLASDPKLPEDYRWLNYYRILEMKFNASGQGLSKNQEYKTFIIQSNAGISVGEIDKIRASIHAFTRGKKGKNLGIGHYNSKYPEAMQRSFPAMQRLVFIIMEKLFRENGHVIKFFSRE